MRPVYIYARLCCWPFSYCAADEWHSIEHFICSAICLWRAKIQKIRKKPNANKLIVTKQLISKHFRFVQLKCRRICEYLMRKPFCDKIGILFFFPVCWPNWFLLLLYIFIVRADCAVGFNKPAGKFRFLSFRWPIVSVCVLCMLPAETHINVTNNIQHATINQMKLMM